MWIYNFLTIGSFMTIL